MATTLQTSYVATNNTERGQDDWASQSRNLNESGGAGPWEGANKQSFSPKRLQNKQEHAIMEKKTPEKPVGLRGRQGSLRRVKDSTDILRERSLQNQGKKENVSRSNTSTRDARAAQFTVANVDGGKIYLRLVLVI
jgi:hypothetical protein